MNILKSVSLPAAWQLLDEFEGIEYQRVLVPVYKVKEEQRLLYTVANLYEMSPPETSF